MERNPQDQPGPGAPEVPVEDLEVPGQTTIEDVTPEPRPEPEPGTGETPADPNAIDDDDGDPDAAPQPVVPVR